MRCIADLTPREREVVCLRCGERELSIKEAADEMFINRTTVKNHGTNLMRKLGTRSFFGVCRMYGEQNAWRTLTAMRPELV